MEATVVASSYSGSFCELNCLVCNHLWLPAASWLVPDPGTVCVALLSLTLGHYSAWKRCGPWVQLPLGDPLHSTSVRWLFAEVEVTVPERHSSFFLVRLTVTLRSLLCEGHRCYSHRTKITIVTVTGRSQTVSRHCARHAKISTKRKFPVSGHFRPVSRRNLQKGESLGN